MRSLRVSGVLWHAVVPWRTVIPENCTLLRVRHQWVYACKRSLKLLAQDFASWADCQREACQVRLSGMGGSAGREAHLRVHRLPR